MDTPLSDTERVSSFEAAASKLTGLRRNHRVFDFEARDNEHSRLCSRAMSVPPGIGVLEHTVSENIQSHVTVKALVCITPCGGISAVTDLFTGSISDSELVERSGMLDIFEPGDAILVDRGVNILEACTARKLDMIMPSFLNGRSSFTRDDVSLSRQVCSLMLL